jgi:hypothetical protein
MDLGAFFAAPNAAKNRAIRLNEILTGVPPAKISYRFYPLRVPCKRATRTLQDLMIPGPAF